MAERTPQTDLSIWDEAQNLEPGASLCSQPNELDLLKADTAIVIKNIGWLRTPLDGIDLAVGDEDDTALIDR